MANEQNDIIEVAARLEFDGVEDIINVFQFKYLTAGVINDQGLADDLIEILEVMYTVVVGLITTITIFRDLRITNKTKSTVLGVYPWDTLVAGTAVDVPQPPGVAALFNYSTGVPRVTPRKFLGGLRQDIIIDDGVWNGSSVALYATAAATMLGILTATLGTYQYGYLSPKTAQFEPVNAVVVTNIPAYQRRRKQGRGS